jgi:hypothetical protein
MLETGRDGQRDMPAVRDKGDERETHALSAGTGRAKPIC